jgi:hypothetical protein
MENNFDKMTNQFNELITLLEISTKINKTIIDLMIKSEALNLTLLEYIENPTIKQEGKKQMLELEIEMDKMIRELKSVSKNTDKTKLN